MRPPNATHRPPPPPDAVHARRVVVCTRGVPYQPSHPPTCLPTQYDLYACTHRGEPEPLLLTRVSRTLIYNRHIACSVRAAATPLIGVFTRGFSAVRTSIFHPTTPSQNVVLGRCSWSALHRYILIIIYNVYARHALYMPYTCFGHVAYSTHVGIGFRGKVSSKIDGTHLLTQSLTNCDAVLRL